MATKETYIFFNEGDNDAELGDSICYPASAFRGIEPVGTAQTKIMFRALCGNAQDDIIQIDTHVAGKFKEICEALADALNSDGPEMVTFADEDNADFTKMLRDLGCVTSSTTINTTLDT